MRGSKFLFIFIFLRTPSLHRENVPRAVSPEAPSVLQDRVLLP